MKLRIAFIYGPWSIGDRIIDIQNLWTSPRGLTGSELSFFQYSREMKKLGHDVHIFMHGVTDQTWEGIPVRPFSSLSTHMNDSWNVMYSWLEVEPLRCVPSSVLRMVNQQVNDFNYCQPGFDDLVDIYTSPSESHREHIKKMTPIQSKWEVMSNGCDPTQYKYDVKVPGRIIWASSPDRGLHLLLQIWPEIFKACPEAHLKIFYNMDDWLSRFIGLENHPHQDFQECACRARYIDLSLRRMSGMRIEKIGSISRTQMAEEMSQAQVLAYPCDTIVFTEGFSVTTMEACAAKVVPLISSVDSLGQIYGNHVPMISTPVVQNLSEFTSMVIRAVKDSSYRDEVISKSFGLANQYTWSSLAYKLEKLMLSKLKS